MRIEGTVIGGSRKAAALGYPTANLPCTEQVSGVYTSTAEVDGARYRAVSYGDPVRQVLETHLFSFSGNLYGKHMAVTLGTRIREPEAFESDAELMRAIASDVESARALHARSS